MKFNREEFFGNPTQSFDCPPPNFEKLSDRGWLLLAKAIVSDSSGLGKYISYAKKWKKKEEEWSSHVIFGANQSTFSKRKYTIGKKPKNIQGKKSYLNTSLLFHPDNERLNTISGGINIGQKYGISPKRARKASMANSPVKRSDNFEENALSTNNFVIGEEQNERSKPRRRLFKKVLKTTGRKTIQTATDTKRIKSRYISNAPQNATMSGLMAKKKKIILGSSNMANYTVHARNIAKRKESNLVKQIKGLQYIRNQRGLEKTQSQTSLRKKKRSYTEDYENDQRKVIESLNKHIARAKKKRSLMKNKTAISRTRKINDPGDPIKKSSDKSLTTKKNSSSKMIYGTSSPNIKTILAIGSPYRLKIGQDKINRL
ncbi:unnamed protein product [Moneuplotes crassus]|uniref:Uncharacterized protein n=1 Tax=Euplotes crassus TaxID=5936 RepID=A0AAD1UID5_EUPCR|nr:unnamed protein product [Moneuplotes crassus]